MAEWKTQIASATCFFAFFSFVFIFGRHSSGNGVLLWLPSLWGSEFQEWSFVKSRPRRKKGSVEFDGGGEVFSVFAFVSHAQKRETQEKKWAYYIFASSVISSAP